MSSSIPPVLPEPKPHKKGESNDSELSESSSFMGQVNNFLGWIAELITEQAKQDTVSSRSFESIKESHEIAVKQQSEVIKNAEKVIKHLEETKLRLMEQYGSSAKGFIAKSLDPMIIHTKQLIFDLSTDGAGDEETSTILNQAVKAVELYQEFNKEEKLVRKIIEESCSLTMQAIDKDVDMLFRYQIQALDEHMGISGGSVVNELAIRLEPIFRELKAISEIRKDITDLHEFFLWKSYIDEKRDALVNLGFFTIDTIISKVAPSTSHIGFEEDYEDESLESLSQLRDPLEKLRIQQLATIEERVLALHEDLESHTLSLSPSTIKEIENVLSDLKNYIDEFYAIGIEDPEVTTNLETTRSHIEKAEEILQKKRKANNQ